MIGRREHAFATGRFHRIANFVTVGGDDDAIRDAERVHALHHAHNERESSEEAKGFPGEPRRAQSCWDDGERSHER